MITIDKLCYHSKLRYVNASEKFAFAILTLLFCVVSRSMAIAVLVLFVTGILTVKKGGIPLSRYLQLMKIPVLFLLLSTVAIMINVSKTPLDAFALPVGTYYLTGSFAGLRQGLGLILTALSSVSCLYFLSLSTSITDILEVLRALHTPPVILELMLLIYRLIFVMLDMVSAITVSQHSRLGNQNIRTARRAFSVMIGAVFIRSVQRSALLYDAMESRCYDGKISVLSEDHPPKRSEVLWIAGFELFLFAATVIILIWRGMR